MSAPLRRAWLRGTSRTASSAGKLWSEPGAGRLVFARVQRRRSAALALGAGARSPPEGLPANSGPGDPPPLRGSAFSSRPGSGASWALALPASFRAFSKARRAGDPASRARGSGATGVGAAWVPLAFGRTSLDEALAAPGLVPAFAWVVRAAVACRLGTVSGFPDPLSLPGRAVGLGAWPPIGGGRGAAGGRGMLPVSWARVSSRLNCSSIGVSSAALSTLGGG